MTQLAANARNRAALLKRLFPEGVPTLWCPTLTHYDEHGKPHASRMAAHLQHLSSHVKGILVPGSTGDGWELSDSEATEILQIVLDQVQKLKLHLLIGILKSDTGATLRLLHERMDWLKARTNQNDAERALSAGRVCGFTICAPRGKDLSQDEIERGLSRVLASGLPIAIYQLPQVTQNEISPEVAMRLALQFENFILFKDSSGTDRIIQSGENLAGVFALRGAEGDYARWVKTAGGPYDGFLLSTANCFAREIAQILQYIAAGRLAEARDISERLTAVVNAVFGL